MKKIFNISLYALVLVMTLTHVGNTGVNSWTRLPGVGTSLNSIAVDESTNPSTLYAGALDHIYTTNDGGSHWADLTSSFFSSEQNISLIKIDNSISTPVIYVVQSGTPNHLFKSMDNGNHWISLTLPEADLEINGIAFDPRSVVPSVGAAIYLATNHGVLKSSDGGVMWSDFNNGTLPSTANIRSLLVDKTTNPSTLYIGTDGQGVMYRILGSGTSWGHVNVGAMSSSAVVTSLEKPVLGGNLFAGVSDVGVLVMSGSPSSPTWDNITSDPLPSTTGDYNVKLDPEYIFAAHGVQYFRKPLTGGAWVLLSSVPLVNAVEGRMAVFSNGNGSYSLYFLAAYNGLFKSINHGDNFSLISHGLPDLSGKDFNVFGADTSSILSVNENILYRHPPTNLWEMLPFGNQLSMAILTSFPVADSRHIYVAAQIPGGENRVMKTQDFGQHWNVINDTQLLTTYRVWGLMADSRSNPAIIYAATQENGLFRYNGTAWQSITYGTILTNTMSVLDLDLDLTTTPASIYCLTQSGAPGSEVYQVIRSVDGGSVWSVLSGGDLPASGVFPYDLALDSYSNPKRVFLSDDHGVVYRLILDGVHSWSVTREASGAGSYLLSINERANPPTVYLSMARNGFLGILKSYDRGNTWTDYVVTGLPEGGALNPFRTPYLSQVVINKDNPKMLYINSEYDLFEMESRVCGNGLVETGETCDDGNLIAGDGCSASCTLEDAPGSGGAGGSSGASGGASGSTPGTGGDTGALGGGGVGGITPTPGSGAGADAGGCSCHVVKE